MVRELIKHNLGEVGATEICKQLDFNAADTELVYELLSEWKPDHTVEDIVAIAQGASLTEHELVKIRQALERPTLPETISAMEDVLASLGYIRFGSNVPRENKVRTPILKTRVFELCHQKYAGLPDLARAMGISVSQGKRGINQKFIVGAMKAFPEYKLDDLFYVTPEGSSGECR